MQIIVSYDSSVANAPAAFKTDVQYVVNLFDTAFSNDVTLNIHIGWGEVNGSPLAKGFIGRSLQASGPTADYTTIVNKLNAQASAPGASPDLVAAVATLLASPDPTGGGTFVPGRAEDKALGLVDPHSTQIDGWVGISDLSNVTDKNATWSFDTTTIPNDPNTTYLVGTLEHEITEVMGRLSDEGIGGHWTVPDLFRFSAPGVRELAPGPALSTGYFSIDNGNTALGSWNNHAARGDLADWDLGSGNGGGPGPFGADAFNDFSAGGVLNQLTNTDLTLLHVMGWEAAQPLNVVFNGEMYFVDNGQQSLNNLVIERGGTVEVADGGVLNGTITFAAPGGLLNLDGPTAPTNLIDGFVAGDTIDFYGAAFGAHASVKLLTGNVLQIVEHGHTYDLLFDPTEDFSGQSFHVANDGFGGTLIFLDPAIVGSPGPGGTSVTMSGPDISNGSGDLDAGHVVTISLAMNEIINVDTTHGTPTLSLNDGGVATYSGGSGTNLLTFTTTIASGENTPDLAITAFNLNGGTAQDNNGHDANFSGALVNPAGILQIDTTPPHVSSASPTHANGSLEWVFNFDEPVNAASNATLLSGELIVDTAASAALNDPAGLVFAFNTGHVASAPANYSDGISDLAGNAPVPGGAPLPSLLGIPLTDGGIVAGLEGSIHSSIAGAAGASEPSPHPSAADSFHLLM
jgi:hypothetical protein